MLYEVITIYSTSVTTMAIVTKGWRNGKKSYIECYFQTAGGQVGLHLESKDQRRVEALYQQIVTAAAGGHSFQVTARITSYNVCYTKLLRPVSRHSENLLPAYPLHRELFYNRFRSANMQDCSSMYIPKRNNLTREGLIVFLRSGYATFVQYQCGICLQVYSLKMSSGSCFIQFL